MERVVKWLEPCSAAGIGAAADPTGLALEQKGQRKAGEARQNHAVVPVQEGQSFAKHFIRPHQVRHP